VVSTRIVISPEIPGRDGLEALPFERFFGAEGEVVARSRSSDTRSVVLAGHPLHVKRYRYSPRQALRGMLRNTLSGPSRVAREYAMLTRVADRLGADVVPRAVAFGEARRFGFLRAAFLATETIPDSHPVTGAVDAASLGRFLRSIHDRGFSHGRLYARNLLRAGDGSLRLVDLDRAIRTDRRAAGRRAALDIACVLASLPGLDGEALIAGYGREDVRDLVDAVMPVAQAGLKKRSGPPHV